MRRLAQLTAGAIFVAVLIGCAAVSQQRTQPPRTDDFHFHNLRVLPQNISRDELIATMRGYTHALGVRCDHCHVQTAVTPEPAFDFPSDARREKNSARTMMLMTRKINHDYVSKIEEVYTTVTCWTCHRGETQPDVQPAVEEPVKSQPLAPQTPG